MYRLNQALVPTLAAEALRVAQGSSTYVLKASNASGETAFGQSTGLNHIGIGDIVVPTDGAGVCISNSVNSTRRRIFLPGRCWQGKFRRRTSRGGSFLSGPALLACSTCGQPRSDAAVPGIDIHAQVLENLLTGNILERPDYAVALEEL